MNQRFRIAAFLGIAVISACSTRAPEPPAAPAAARSPIPLDPEGSPLPFRRLSDEAVLVDPAAGQRSLASLGNYIGRSARQLSRARLAVWNDEAAWRRSLEADEVAQSVFAHKRAEYLKEAGPTAVEEYQVFDRQGEVVYERDFRDWPLTGTDVE